jgi:serine protease SohB
MTSEAPSTLHYFITTYFTFYHVSLLFFLLSGVILLWRVFRRRRSASFGDRPTYLSFRYLNERFDKDLDALHRELHKRPFLPKAARKLLQKAQKKEDKAETKESKEESQSVLAKIKEQLSSGKSTEDVIGEYSNRVYVLSFNGNIMASAVEQLREEISFLLHVALPSDEIVVRLTSPGGAVAQYGYASAQLLRLKQAGLKCTVCVDTIAASGGYMMAVAAEKIVAAPFAFIGSIGVVAGLPNFHRVLQKNEVDYFLFTAGKYKRTVTPFSEVTEEGKEKFQADLGAIHDAFKAHVAENRKDLAIDEVATGEYWLASKALELKLIDQIQTSDDYLYQKMQEDKDVIEIRTVEEKRPVERLLQQGASVVQQVLNTRLPLPLPDQNPMDVREYYR